MTGHFTPQQLVRIKPVLHWHLRKCEALLRVFICGLWATYSERRRNSVEWLMTSEVTILGRWHLPGRTHEVTTGSLTYSIWHIPNTKEGHVKQPLKRAPRVGFWGSFPITECVIKLQARENDGATNYITSRMEQFLSLRDVNARRSEPLCSVPPSRQPMFVDWYASCPEFPWPVGNHQAEGTFCCFHVTWMFVTIFTKLRYNSPPGMFIRCSGWCSNTPFCKIFIAQSI
jgi:hypothetical protein